MRLKYPLIIAVIVVYMTATSSIGRWSELTWDDIRAAEALRGPFFGLIVALGMIGPHIFSLRKRFRRYVAEFPRAESEPVDSSRLTQTLVVPRSCAGTFDLCREAVKTINGTCIARADPHRINARTGISWGSWGERIEFRLQPIGERFTELQVCSRPVLWRTPLDGGRSLDHIISVCSYIRDQTKTVHMAELIAA
jgi:hypothetical protein